jgi:hypothetical protein
MLDRFVGDKVQPARCDGSASEWPRSTAYSCRGMNGDPGADISEHAFGSGLRPSAEAHQAVAR